MKYFLRNDYWNLGVIDIIHNDEDDVITYSRNGGYDDDDLNDLIFQ